LRDKQKVGNQHQITENILMILLQIFNMEKGNLHRWLFLQDANAGWFLCIPDYDHLWWYFR